MIGRLTRDPEVRYTTGAKSVCVAEYSLAVDRKFKRDGEQDADFITCVAIGKGGEFVEKYLRKGVKIAVSGRIQTGNYTKKDGTKGYSFKVVVEEHEFCESKNAGGNQQQYGQQYGQQPQPQRQQAPQQQYRPQQQYIDDLMNIPDDIGDMEELPFQ